MSHINQALEPGGGTPPAPPPASSGSTTGTSGEALAVRPELLEDAASRADDMEAELRDGVKDVGPETTAAVHGLAGWATGTKLKRTESEWKDKLVDLANRLGGVSERLRLTARNYRNVDESSADSFGGGGGRGGGDHGGGDGRFF